MPLNPSHICCRQEIPSGQTVPVVTTHANQSSVAPAGSLNALTRIALLRLLASPNNVAPNAHISAVDNASSSPRWLKGIPPYDHARRRDGGAVPAGVNAFRRRGRPLRPSSVRRS